jgi:hypothetical protein
MAPDRSAAGNADQPTETVFPSIASVHTKTGVPAAKYSTDADESYECEGNCGAIGTYDEIAEHEKRSVLPFPSEDCTRMS